jgi:hypothetical protein
VAYVHNYVLKLWSKELSYHRRRPAVDCASFLSPSSWVSEDGSHLHECTNCGVCTQFIYQTQLRYKVCFVWPSPTLTLLILDLSSAQAIIDFFFKTLLMNIHLEITVIHRLYYLNYLKCHTNLIIRNDCFNFQVYRR